MGAEFSAELYTVSAGDAEASLDSIREHLETVEATMGWRVSTSELTRLNDRGADEYYEVEDQGLYRLIRLALDYAQFTRGTFDPTLGPLVRLYGRESGRLPTPTEVGIVLDRVGWDHVIVAPEAHSLRFARPGMELDLGGLVPAYALDVAGRSFAQMGSRAGLLRLDGNILAWNMPPETEAWEVAIADPRDKDRPLLTVDVANRSLAVVGHPTAGRPTLFDPRTGLPASSDLLAVVAIADSVADAAALARALFVGGSADGGELLARMVRAEAVLLLDGNGAPLLMASSTLRDHLRLSPQLEAEVGSRVRYILPPQSIGLESPLASWSPSR
jgi:thiamine biosynthesis lipoprotein